MKSTTYTNSPIAVLTVKRGKLWRNDELILLSPKASELLALLLERNGEYISKDEIFEKVWADTFVEDGVLTQNIYTLRKAIGKDSDGQPIIENKTRLGYRDNSSHFCFRIKMREVQNDCNQTILNPNLFLIHPLPTNKKSFLYLYVVKSSCR